MTANMGCNNIKMQDLENVAQSIPSMGGSQIGQFLREIVKTAPPETAVVEIGSWLGAGTAQLALGMLDRAQQQKLAIHCYDQWLALPGEMKKVKANSNSTIIPGQDILQIVEKTLDQFQANIHFHKGDIGVAKWNGGPISILVDDASKKPKNFFHMLKTFGPSWIPGETIVVLMDFHYWKKARSKSYKCQRDFITKYSDHFSPMEHASFNGLSVAAFRYLHPIEFNFAFNYITFRSILSKILG